ncbi:MAG: DUF4139 domain-containing protein [Spirochaetaceae bacterium]|jgi:hypothetical protein|nr:DUF4139 domain-containing protein [Spirochaetaceae bacterium]
MKKNLYVCALFSALCLLTHRAFSQNTADETRLPLKKISIFSSGVSYFEHRGPISPEAALTLNFNSGTVNDALKSLVINDPEAALPDITYQSETTLIRTLRSLKINLSGNPGMAGILSSLKGEEIQMTASTPAPATLEGRIVAVETSPVFLRGGEGGGEPSITISTPNGIRMIKLKDIQSLNFKNAAINADLIRALDIIRSSNNGDMKTLNISLSGKSRRDIGISYVIPSPVWKVSYRLEINGGGKSLLQGWAIIDNDGDIDWTDVEISLVTGRPVSFIQNLYPPYYVNRPVLPLAIAGAAEARTYESGYGGRDQTVEDSFDMARGDSAFEIAADEEALAPRPQAMAARALSSRTSNAVSPYGGALDTARGADAGDQFEFTLKNPVTLARQQSAMLPLVEGTFDAEKTLVFSGQRAMTGVTLHPAISVRITNNSGMKLPAGPVTVFDGGVYAGDALIEFLPEGEKRIISYGDDLSVSGVVISSFKRVIDAVTASRGVMTLSRKNINERIYTIRNSARSAKKLVIEHPVTRGAALTEPAKFDEQTATLYRFSLDLAAGATLNFPVIEETPVFETINLSGLSDAAFAAFSSNAEIPEKARKAFAAALALKRGADEAAKKLSELEAQRVRLTADEERIRNNIEAAGKESPQGQEYLLRLAGQDAAIEAQNTAIDAARAELAEAEKAYKDYLNAIDL